jgi:prepilin peptidase CpaA
VYELPLLLLFPAAMAFAAAMDVLTMTIPNRISLALIVGFFVLAPFAGLNMQTFLMHLTVGFAMLLVGVALFSGGLVGGGDAKLLAAGALWVGAEHLTIYLAGVALVGGVLSLTVLAYRHLLPIENLPLPGWAKNLHAKESGIPYGVAIAGGALLVYPTTPWFLAFSS